MNDFKNILLINFGGIGDEILFSPVINALKDTYPNAKITLCLEERSKAFLDLTNNLNSYFFINIKTKNKYIEMLKLYFKALTGRYDLVISSGANPLISFLLYLTGIKTKIGYETSNLSKKLLTHAIELNKQQYAAKMYFDLVRPVSDNDFKNPCINHDNYEKIANSVLIHPGVSKISIAKNITKTFNARQWAEIIEIILNAGKNVYLAGGPDDKNCIEEIRKILKEKCITNYTDMFGKTKNIKDLTNLITKSGILICSDSAPMHIGIATNTKTIAVFGPTDESVLIPNSPNFIALKNQTECRPCLWAKRQETCKELKCLKIDLKEILKYL